MAVSVFNARKALNYHEEAPLDVDNNKDSNKKETTEETVKNIDTVYTLDFLYDYVFPNFNLPNALPTDQMLINYFSSQHHITNTDQAVNTPNDPGANQVMKMLTEYDWAPSANHSNLVSPGYSSVLHINEDPVYPYREKINYVYFIKISPYFTEFTGYGINDSFKSKINGNFFWKYISRQALEDIRQGRAVIFLDYGQENHINRNEYDYLHLNLEFSKIPKEQIVLGINSFNAKEIYENWFLPRERRLTVVNWPFMTTNSSWHYCEHKDNITQRLKSVEDRPKSNYFLFKNRRPREHRLAMLLEFAKRNLLRKSDWSCIDSNWLTKHEITKIEKKYETKISNDIIVDLKAKLPHNLQHEPNFRDIDIGGFREEPIESYLDSYFMVCTETYTDNDYKSFTEKVYQPIAHCMPFLLVSWPRSLKKLKDLGFKTFAPYIDESYDEELDQYRRVMMIINEVERLCKMNREEIHEWHKNLMPILKHNQQHLFGFYKNPKYADMQHELIKYLGNKTNK
jgi:hypothetical protein